MTDIFEQAIGGNNGSMIYTEERRNVRPPDYHEIVGHVAMQWAIVTWGTIFTLAFSITYVWQLAIGNGDKLLYLFRPGTEWAVMIAASTAGAGASWLVITWNQLEKFRQAWTVPTKRTITTQPQQPDVTQVMEIDATGIPYNSATLQTNIPRQRLGVHVAGYSLSGKRLDALQTHGLNRDAQRMTGTEYQRLTDALARAGLAKQVGRSWQWTEAGEAWIATAGLPHPDN